MADNLARVRMIMRKPKCALSVELRLPQTGFWIRDPSRSGLVTGGKDVAAGGRSSNPSLVLPEGSDPEALFRTHGPWLLRSLRRRFGREVADDLLQETYLRILRQKGPVEVQRPRAFLLQIARNLFITDYRRERLRVAYEEPQASVQPDRAQACQVESLVLQEIILGMPVKLRDVFILSRFGGLNQQEIADQLGITRKTVEWRMTRALAYCAAQLRT